jgi:hypothetical protein
MPIEYVQIPRKKKKKKFFSNKLYFFLLYENLLYVVQVHDLTNVNMHRRFHLHLLLEDHLLLLDYKKKKKFIFKLKE